MRERERERERERVSQSDRRAGRERKKTFQGNLHGVDPLSYFSFQPVFHDWCNKGYGMYDPVSGTVTIPCSFISRYMNYSLLILYYMSGAGRSSEVERSLMVRWVVGSILHGVDPLSYFSFQPLLHDWCNKGVTLSVGWCI